MSRSPLSVSRIVLAGIVGFACTAAMAGEIASSTFDTDDEDWRLVSTLGYDGPVDYSATGGNPGGFIYGQDPDTGAFGFGAPSDFLGPISAAYGHELTFDVASYQTPDVSTSWVGMRGVNDLELISYYNAPTSAYPAWHSRSVSMVETAWVRVSDGQPPTYAQFMSVLNDLDGLVILAEFVEGLETDISGLDNVVLVPEPTTALLLVAGGLLAARRQRR